MLHARLVKAGLVAPREEIVFPEKTVVRLGDHIDRYIQSRAKLKPNTLRNYQTTRRLLVTHFGTRCGSRRPGAVTRIKNSGPNSGPLSAGQMQS